MKKGLLIFGLACTLAVFTQCTKDDAALKPEVVNSRGGDIQTRNGDLMVFELILVNPGERKLQVIKIYQAITGCSLADAKYAVDSCPTYVGMFNKADADGNKRLFEEAGATCELR